MRTAGSWLSAHSASRPSRISRRTCVARILDRDSDACTCDRRSRCRRLRCGASARATAARPRRSERTSPARRDRASTSSSIGVKTGYGPSSKVSAISRGRPERSSRRKLVRHAIEPRDDVARKLEVHVRRRRDERRRHVAPMHDRAPAAGDQTDDHDDCDDDLRSVRHETRLRVIAAASACVVLARSLPTITVTSLVVRRRRCRRAARRRIRNDDRLAQALRQRLAHLARRRT